MKQTPVEFLENYLKIKGLIIHSPDNIIIKPINRTLKGHILELFIRKAKKL